jgi:hypothetical protein
MFRQAEIPENRRMNQNGSSMQVFKQYVLRVQKGNTAEPDFTGYASAAFGVSYGQDIPARITRTIIDVDRILRYYTRVANLYGAGSLPFTGADLVASTTAHEIGHGVNLPHHGLALPHLPGCLVPRDTTPRIRIFDYRGTPEILARPYMINGPVGSPNSHESGNVSCFMGYRNKTYWVRKIAGNNEMHYFKVPWLPAGSMFCESKDGTDINRNNGYYGNAVFGECLGGIKLRD